MGGRLESILPDSGGWKYSNSRLRLLFFCFTGRSGADRSETVRPSVTHSRGRYHPTRPAAPRTRKARQEARSEIAGAMRPVTTPKAPAHSRSSRGRCRRPVPAPAARCPSPAPPACGWPTCRLRRSVAGLAVSRPTPLGGFSYRLQPCRRQLPFLGLRRLGWLRLLLFLRRPSRLLRGGDPGAGRLAHRAALLWTRAICSGRPRYRGFWLAWTALAELRFDAGYLR